jgi:anti-anti-sigma regulatory factor
MFKIDTKEKFIVFTPETSTLTANMAAKLITEMQRLAETQDTNIILDMHNVATVNQEVLEQLAACKADLYSKNKSFVLCACTEAVQQTILESEMDEALNYVPTQSEAWDIVQMDEIERELMNGDFNDD